MKIGMNLPVMVPGLDRDLILEWSRRIDAGPYSTLAAGERITFPNPEVMITMSAAAAVTAVLKTLSIGDPSTRPFDETLRGGPPYGGSLN